MSDTSWSSLEPIAEANGIGPATLENIREARYTTAEEVSETTPEELATTVDGIGYTTAVTVLNHLDQANYRDSRPRTEAHNQLISLLKDLFEFENSNRTFGVYNLLNELR